MAQWGKVFTVAGVTVVPHISTHAFDPARPESLVDDFMISNTEVGADTDRARTFLDPFRGKPYADLLKVLDEMCVMPVKPEESGQTAHDVAVAAMDRAFGIGIDEAHRVIRTDPAARRIYDCAIAALMGRNR